LALLFIYAGTGFKVTIFNGAELYRLCNGNRKKIIDNLKEVLHPQRLILRLTILQCLPAWFGRKSKRKIRYIPKKSFSVMADRKDVSDGGLHCTRLS
jgi:hypothetical protein